MSGNQKGWTANDEMNWDEISDAPPPPLEDGIYRASIAKAEAEPTGKGDPAISLQLVALHAHGSDAKLNRKLYDKLVVTKDAAFRTKQVIKATGATPPKTNGSDALSEFASELVGCEVWVRTKQQTFQGKVNAKVDMYIADDKLEAVLKGDDGSGGSAAPTPKPRRQRPAAG